MSVRFAVVVLHAAFDETRCAGFEHVMNAFPEGSKHHPLRVLRETTRRGSTAPWLEGLRWAAEQEHATHFLFLPDDVLLWSGSGRSATFTSGGPEPRTEPENFLSIMTRIVSARPDDVLCCLSNHRDARLAFAPKVEREFMVALAKAAVIDKLRAEHADDRTILARMAEFSERYNKLLGELSRDEPYPFYSTPDGATMHAGVIPIPLVREHLAWRETHLSPKANLRTAGDEGVNLWAMATGRRIYKPLPSPVQHDLGVSSLEGNDGQEAVYGRTSKVLAAADYDWSRWNVNEERASNRNHNESKSETRVAPEESNQVRPSAARESGAERENTADLGRTAMSLHWDVLFKARVDVEDGKPGSRVVVAQQGVPGGSYLRGAVTEEIVERVYAVERGAPPRASPIVRRYEPGKVVDIDYPEGVQIFVATPAYSPALHAMTRSREATLRHLHDKGIQSWVNETGGHSFVPLARQQLVHKFLCSRSTHLLFWDADIEVVDPTALFRMIRTGHPVVGLAYPYRDGTGRVVGNPLRDANTGEALLKVDPDDTMVVSELGTGFMLIQREVILRMVASRPDILHALDSPDQEWSQVPCWAIFDSCMMQDPRAPWRKRYLTEDFTFCTLWRSLAGQIRCYVPPTVRHWGTGPSEGHISRAWGITKEAKEAKP